MIALVALSMVSAVVHAEETVRFRALLFDGSQVGAAKFGNHGWWSDEAMLGGRRLFGTPNPVRMLEDRTLIATPRGPHLVMANGDVLPGRIVGCLPASEAENLPVRLLVALASPLITADPRGLAVRADRVLRIKANTEETPVGESGTLVLADGANMSATAVRWSDQGVKALTPSRTVAVSFDAIGDLCVPKADRMCAVLDDAYYPPLGLDAVLGRLETVHGAVLTYHRDMTLVGVSKATPRPGRGSQPSPYVLVWPGWSLGAVLVPIDSIWRQSFRAAREVPLSLLPATVLREKVGIHHWPWRRNENVEGGTLASGHISVDLGLGTHSYCEIAFELPPHAQAFTTLVGLDRLVGRGACAAGKIHADQVGSKPLYASPCLTGGQEPLPVGLLGVAGVKRLVLVTEPENRGRPPGTYPLDIGDHVDWLMPLVTIGSDVDRQRESLARFVPGWRSWQLDTADVDRLNIGPYWDAIHERWLPALYAAGAQPLAIHRTLSSVSSANDRVELIFAHAKDAPLPAIELSVDGTRLAPLPEQHDDRVDADAADPSRPTAQAGTTRLGTVNLDRRSKPEPVPQPPTQRQTPGRNGRVGEKTGDTSPAESEVQYRVRTMRWDLRTFHGRAAQLKLNITLDKQPKGVLWRELTVKSAL